MEEEPFWNDTLRFWNFRKSTKLRFFQNKEKNYGVPFQCVYPKFSLDGRWILYASYIDRERQSPTPRILKTPDSVRIRELKTGRIIRSFPSRQVIAFAISPDGKTLVISDYSLPRQKEPSRITAYNIINKSRKWTTITKSRSEYYDIELRVLDLAFSPDGKTLACQDNVGDVTIRNANTGALLTVLEKPRIRVRDNIGGGSRHPALYFSANGEILLLRTSQGIRLWRTDDWKHKL